MKPVTTLIRQVLTENKLWKPGFSVTYQDTSKTKTLSTRGGLVSI